jgi:amyloid beta precursor protein binding protein 1
MATNEKYDRQLRLWGAKGQQALGDTHVVLVGASAAGCESLKNLVLPGIGSFSVVDDCAVTKQDAASNFFLPTTSIGTTTSSSARAQVASEQLRELNPDVQGSFQSVSNLSEVADWKSLLYKDKGMFKKLLVIASDLNPNLLESLSQVCTTERIPLLLVQSYGLMGIVRLQLSGQVALLDPKPTNAHPDLRLQTSFPALDVMARSIDFKTLENHQHGHVPYPIILYQALHEWKSMHDTANDNNNNDNNNNGNGTKGPSSMAEKQEFQALVKSKSRDYNMELNFQEAVQNAYLAYAEQSVTIPDGLDPSSTLGLLYQALRAFMDQHQGRPPLNGSIPDMTASTDWYIQLQGIYKDQADKDLAAMKAWCTAQTSNLSEDDITSFCSNVFVVDQMQTRSLMEEFQQAPTEELLDDWRMEFMDPYEVPEHTPLLWYLGVRACQVFFQQHGRYPGTVEPWEPDVELLQEHWTQVAQHYQLHDQELVQQHAATICQELTRYANAEIHTVASVVGGVASQEAVKIITGQYIPLDNTYVFNGIVSVAGVYRF